MARRNATNDGNGKFAPERLRGSLSRKARELKIEVDALDKAIAHLQQIRGEVYERYCQTAYTLHCEQYDLKTI